MRKLRPRKRLISEQKQKGRSRYIRGIGGKKPKTGGRMPIKVCRRGIKSNGKGAGMTNLLASLGHTAKRVVSGHTLNTRTQMRTDAKLCKKKKVCE